MGLKDWNANLKRILLHCDTVHHYSDSLVETYFAYLAPARCLTCLLTIFPSREDFKNLQSY